jgi:hypothetical protein
VLAQQQRDRGSLERRLAPGSRFLAPGSGFLPPGARRQPSPRHSSAEAQAVQQLAAVVGHASRQHVALPRDRGELEPLELLDHSREPLGAARLVLARHVLPVREEAQEFARRDRLDLGAQPRERVAMDAREEAPVAPFDLGRAGGEASPEDAALAFEGEEQLGRIGPRAIVALRRPG